MDTLYIARLANKILRIPADAVDRYLAQGYTITDAQGNVLKKGTPSDSNSLKLGYEQQKQEIESLKAQVKTLADKNENLTKKIEVLVEENDNLKAELAKKSEPTEEVKPTEEVEKPEKPKTTSKRGKSTTPKGEKQ